jgi:hypothetical protein
MAVESDFFRPVPPRSAGRRIPPAFEAVLVVVVSQLLLIPCFWQQHVQAGDFSSHLYNAWLARQLRSTPQAGISIVHPWTNVLADYVLEALTGSAGVYWTERIVAGAAVLVFFWGAFFLISSATGRRPWWLAPCLGILSYGVIFHLGFLNYYISTGLCLWILALLWNPTALRIVLAIAIALLALLAHPMPLAWVLAVLGYLHLARRLTSFYLGVLMGCSLVTLLLAEPLTMGWLPARWSFGQLNTLEGLLGISGLDQAWLFGRKYLIVAGALLLLWIALLLERVDRGGMLRDPLVHLWLLHCAAFALLPSAIQLPQYQHVLAYIPQRISLFTAILLYVVVAGARYGRVVTGLSAVASVIFFSFLYVDTQAYDRVEREVAGLLEGLTPGQRVVASIADSGARLPALTHVVDRPCIEHCFSYGNYEAATGQFRIRVYQPNSVIASSMLVVQELEDGRHVVTLAEAPLYAVCQCEKPDHRLCLRMLRAGQTTCGFTIQASPAFLVQTNQHEIPRDQDRVPAVDADDDAGTLAPHAVSAQDNRHHFAGQHARQGTQAHQGVNERAGFLQPHSQPPPGGQEVQRLQVQKDLETEGPVFGIRTRLARVPPEFGGAVHGDFIGRRALAR